LKQKLAKMELRPEMVAQRLKDLQENREYHATAIQKVIDQQMDSTVAQQMNSGGGGRAVLDSALNLILKVCPP
jgi:CHASE3 domain sensor protein